MNVVLLRPNHVSGDCPQTRRSVRIIGIRKDSNVTAPGRRGCLNRVRGNRNLVHARAFGCRVDEYLGCRLRRRIVSGVIVVFNIVASYL